MYIAERYLRAMGPTGKVISYLPGDEIPDFASWPQNARMAHLNQHLVVYRPKQVEVTPAPEAAPATQVAAQPKVAVDVSPPASEAFCEQCQRTFKDASGLRIHRARAHRQPIVPVATAP